MVMVIALMVATHYALRKPAQFPFALLIMGLFQFGAEAAGGLNLSALWLLGLIALTIAALCTMPGPRLRLSVPEMAYMAFLGWACLSMFRSPDLMYGVRMLLKLTFPFLVMLLARRAAASGRMPNLYKSMGRVILASFLAFLLVGGITQRYLFVVVCQAAGWLWAVAAFADHMAVMGVVALAFWRVFGNRWYLAYGILAGISPVFAGIRTGVGAFAIGVSVLLLVGYRKVVAVPLLVGIYLLGGAAILFVPAMKDHMFHDAAGVDSTAIIRNPLSVSLDNVNNSGREMLWTTVLSNLWEPHILGGSGLGAVQHFMYTQRFTRLKVVHSSYVEFLCDMGLVGLGLYVTIVLCCVAEAWRIYRRHSGRVLKALALSTVGAFPALLFCMGFDNVVNYVLVAGQYPFALAGLTMGLAERHRLRDRGQAERNVRPRVFAPAIRRENG